MAHASPDIVGAIAQQLLEELDTYQRLLAEFESSRWDAGRALTLAEQADRVQLCAQTLPRIAVSYTEFLISRAELSHALFTRVGSAGEALPDEYARHVGALDRLQRACQRVRSSATSVRSGEGAASALAALERARGPGH